MADDAGDGPAPTRRSLLRRAGAVGLTGVGLAGCTGDGLDGETSPAGTAGSGGANGSGPEDGWSGADGGRGATDEERTPAVDYRTRRDTYPIMEGTAYETTVHVLQSAADGPTALLLGGVHGNETGGIAAARLATEYDVGRGTLVVIPETNAPAVADETRRGPDGDLNRQFPVGEAPTTALARAVWGVLREHDPDHLVDMHTSKGVYRYHDAGVGQVIFPHGGDDALADARAAADRVNERYLGELLGGELPAGYAFRAVTADQEVPHMDEGEDRLLLATKAARDGGVEGWVTEVTYRGFDPEEVRFLHDRLTTALLAGNAVPTRSPLDDAENPLLD